MKNTYSDTIFKRKLKFIEIIFRYIKNRYSSKNLKVYIDAKNDTNPLIIIKRGFWGNKKTFKIHLYEEWITVSFLNYFYVPTTCSLHKRNLIISRDKNIFLEKLIYSREDYYNYEYEVRHITSDFVRLNEIFLNYKIFSIIDSEITKFLNESNENKRFFDFFNFSLFSKRKI